MAHEHDGHRHRIIQKLERGALVDHEILEILLYLPLPRKNTNDLAHRLVERFGSVLGVYDATMKELQQVEGVGEQLAAYLYSSGLLHKKMLQSRAEENGFKERFDSKAFVPFVREQYAAVQKEVLDIYLLDGEGYVFKKLRFSDKKTHEVEVTPTELTEILTGNAPSGVVFVHNHPCGTAEPSQSDEEMTNRCQLICNMYGVLLCDHFIYAPDGVYSYYLSSRMSDISKNYAVSVVTEANGVVREKK